MTGLSSSPNRSLWVAKVLFFCTAMSNVGWQRFQNSFYLDSGLNSQQIGSLKAVGLLLKIIGEPFWSMVADLTDEKAIFGLCMVMQVLTMEMLRLSKPLTYNLILIVKVLRTTTAPSNTLTNTASFKLTEGTNEGYGQQRTFGSVAWGTGALVAGYLIDAFGMNSVFYYTYFFNAVTLFFIVYVLPSASPAAADAGDSKLPSDNGDSETGSLLAGEDRGISASVAMVGLKNRSRSRSTSGDGATMLVGHTAASSASSPSSSSSSSSTSQPAVQSKESRFKHAVANLVAQAGTYVHEVSLFFAHPTCRALLVNAFFYGVVMTVPETFLFISLEKDFEASRTYSGTVTTMSVIGCIPLFWFSSYFITKYGHFHIILMSECSCLVRLFAYALLMPSWPFSLYLLPAVQLIHGLNFALYWAAAVDAIHKLSPRELTTTSMATLNVAYATFGAAVGNLLWGYVYDKCGGVTTVYNFSALLLIFTIAIWSGSSSLLSAGSLHPVDHKGAGAA